MNCEEFQRRLLEEPASRDAAFLAHAESCARCHAQWKSALEFEERLKAVLLHQEPLPGVAPPRPGGGRRHLAAALLGLAASVLIVIGIARIPEPSLELARLVVEHVRAEPEMLSRERPVDPMRVASVMASQRYGMRRQPSSVVAAAPCWIRNGRGVHLVVRGDAGPVTILIMPGETLAAKQRVRGEPSLQGLLLPAVQGSVAVVAESLADLEESVDYLRENLLWRGKPAMLTF